MVRSVLPCIVVLSLAACPVAAQTSKPDEERRAFGTSLLLGLMDEVQKGKDEQLRARILSRIADALWEADSKRGWTLFSEAWDAAEKADADSARLSEEARTKPSGGPAPYFPDIRSEVLLLAAKRDLALGEDLLARLAPKGGTVATASLVGAPAALEQRLRLARRLIAEDPKLALQIAELALKCVSMNGLAFITSLRDRDSAAADQRFAGMVAAAALDPQSDANTVSLLSSYLFTPNYFVKVGREGGRDSAQWGRRVAPPEVSADLRTAYLQAAAQILLRTLTAEEEERTSAGALGKFRIIQRLMPAFEQYGPQDSVEKLRDMLTSLAKGKDWPAGDDDELLKRTSPDREAADHEKASIARLGSAATPLERDGIYLELAMMTSDRGDLRARNFLEKIESAEVRQSAKNLVEICLAIRALDSKDAEKAQEIAHDGGLSPIQKVWVLTQVARQLQKTERGSARKLVEEALVEARRIDSSDLDRPRGLMAVANAFSFADPPRAWEILAEAVIAANATAGFTGTDGRLNIFLKTNLISSSRIQWVGDFDVDGAFEAFTLDDYKRAVESARGFNGQIPRATALCSIGRTLLGKVRK
ncbi:MAG: hypothetical protein AAB074_02030 [Planctomycetota bacterium]